MVDFFFIPWGGEEEISKSLNKQIYTQDIHKSIELQSFVWVNIRIGGQSVSLKLLPPDLWWLEQNEGRGFIGWIRIHLAIVQIMNYLKESQLSQKDRLHLTLGLQTVSRFEEGRGDTRTNTACFGERNVELHSSKAGNLVMTFRQCSTPTFSVWKRVVQHVQ